MKRGSAANWASTNPVLAAGEWGVELDTGKKKMGDGTTAWVSLPYSDPDLSGFQATSEKGLANGYAPLNEDAKVPEGNLPDATTANAGILLIATDEEVADGTNTEKATTPAQVAAKQSKSEKGAANGYAPLDVDSKVPGANLPEASTTDKGIAQGATDAEVNTGTNETKFINPKQLQNAVSGSSGPLMPTSATWKMLGQVHALPAGGTWAYCYDNGDSSYPRAGVAAGGSTIHSGGYPGLFLVWQIA
jgi:hypothetical protein